MATGTRLEPPASCDAPAAAPPTGWRRRRWLGGVVVLALLTAGLVRFVTAGADVVASPAAVPATLADVVTQLEQRVAADGDDPTARQALATAYVQRAIETADPSFYGLAERALDEADALAPGEPATLVARGTLALSLHEFDEARRIGELARRAAPTSADALGVAVDAAVELGAYDEAASLLQQMADLRPDLTVLSRVSYLRELNGDLDGAIEAMRRAEAAGAGAPFAEATVAALLGDLLLDAGDLDAAAAAYDRARERAPGHVGGEVGRARVLAARGDQPAAIAALSDLTTTRPQPDALVLLADLQRAVGDRAAASATDEVVRSLAALQQAAGQVVDLELAVFEADRGDDPSRAVELAEQAYAARPDNVFAADALAWALHRAGRSAEAVPHVASALRLGSRDPVLRFHAASIHAAVDDADAAREHLAIVASAAAFPVAHVPAAAGLAAELGVELGGTWQVDG